MKSLTRLLNPTSIAFVGGNECAIAIRRTQELGFTGTIHAVHPKRDELSGVPALKSPEDIPEGVDAAFIAVKNEPTISVVRELSKKGCGGAVIYAAGFAETGNTELQRKLLEAANGMPLMGPNCYGFVNTLSRAALWPDETGLEPVERGAALITQSGNIACNFTMMMRGLPVAAVFSIGNQVDVGMHDMVETLSADPRISAIGLHVEGLPDVAAFAKAAAIARKRKVPIVVLKTGRSEQGAKVAMSHTSSLAGADTLYDALFERYGIARMKSVSAFAETLKFLHNGGPIAGSRLVSLSCSGGEAALVADMALEKKVSFPPFNAGTKPRVAATLNEYVAVDNPLDYHTFIWGQPEKLTATFTEVLKGGFDVGMVILDTPTHPKMKPDSWATTARAMAAASKATGARATVVASLSEGMPLWLAGELSQSGVAPMMGLDDALTAFEAAAFIGCNWTRGEDPPEMLPPLVKGHDEHVFSESAAKELLKNHGLSVPEGIVCPAEDAVAAAETLGYPVTLKVSSAAIAHKTEAGGVALNLRTADEVREAAARMAKLAPDVLVERMVSGAVAELIIGLTSDPQFGTALVVGAGGILTELLKDSVTLILPTTRSEIERALKTLKVWTLVEGFRGKSGDSQAVFRAVEAVADFANANRGLVEELDVNPLLVLKDGAVAVDALIKMRTP
ncbi:MAG: acetate--CoA ligase family protein [Aestuariivirga sp.]|uniref:acetate--CoA ligase family protein n=1 Tax=Aestuariivirga sp. TaxID=2650926 RepID=UPI0025C5D175|nr:acetate--CoA ligase family protein [Aestuariivirga sp.]MCA3560611.1 acetate--CoA ligase family protein [Aestuariivirga sp.]